MPSDDAFARPDVRALLEAVAAGDDPTAAAVLADLLDEAGAGHAAACIRGGDRCYVREDRPPASILVAVGWEPGVWTRWDVYLPDRGGVVWVERGRATKTRDLAMGRPETDLAAALAEAADRLAARAAAAESPR